MMIRQVRIRIQNHGGSAIQCIRFPSGQSAGRRNAVSGKAHPSLGNGVLQGCVAAVTEGSIYDDEEAYEFSVTDGTQVIELSATTPVGRYYIVGAAVGIYYDVTFVSAEGHTLDANAVGYYVGDEKKPSEKEKLLNSKWEIWKGNERLIVDEFDKVQLLPDGIIAEAGDRYMEYDLDGHLRMIVVKRK